jgi:pyruvate dehydrogenase E2 component (dihydrolipoamide acetyltransferase)
MAVAWQQIPHVHHMDQADITDLEALRRKYKAEIEAQGGRLTLTALALKAVVAGLKAYPMLNASLDVAAEEIVYKRYYHIGVATDTERGLVVPVIRDVDRKSVAQLSAELAATAERVRTGNIAPEDLRGGTFTLTNIGMLGGTGATPIINYPEVAILALGAARLQPVVRETADGYSIVPRLILPLSLGFDHRVADGADAARFVKRVIELLENPERMLLNV